MNYLEELLKKYKELQKPMLDIAAPYEKGIDEMTAKLVGDEDKARKIRDLSTQGASMIGSISNVGSGAMKALPMAAKEAEVVGDMVPKGYDFTKKAMGAADDFEEGVFRMADEAAPSMAPKALPPQSAQLALPPPAPVNMSTPKALPYVVGGGLGALGLMDMLRGSPSVKGEPPMAPMASQPPMPEAPQALEAPIMPPPADGMKPPASIAPRAPAQLEAPLPPPQKSIDFGDGQDRMAAFMAAQEGANRGSLVGNLGQSANLIGSSIAHVKPVGQELFQKNIEQAQAMPGQVKETMALDKKDPNSPVSKGYRDYMKKLGLEVKGDASAEDLEKILPNVFKEKEMELARQNQKDMQADRLDARKEEGKFRQAVLAVNRQTKEDQRGEEFARQVAPKVTGKEYEKLMTLDSMTKQMDELVNKPNPQNDLALLYGFVRSLDPDSVVREGEISFVRNARSIPTTVKSSITRGLKGEILTPKERENVKNFAINARNVQYGQWKTTAAPYLQQAKKRGVDASLILPEVPEAPSQSQQKSVVKKGYNPKTNQTQFIYADGTKEIKDGKL